MRTFIVICLIFFTWARSDADYSQAEENNTVYVKMDYMSLINSISRDHSGEHMELETGFWAGMYEKRIRMET